MHYITQTALLELACVAGLFPRRRLQFKKDFILLILLILGIGLSPILSNYSLLFNSVATYQFAKMLQTPSIVLGEYLWQGKKQTVRSALYLAGICLGVTISTVNDSIKLSLVGVIAALGAILLSTLYKVGTAVAIRDQGWESMQIMHAVFPIATAINICLAALLEGPQLLRVNWTFELTGMIMFSCVAAFAVSWSQCLVVGACSALAHSLLGQAKTAVVIIWAWLFLSAPTNWVQLLGAAVSLGCLVLYTNEKGEPPAQAQVAELRDICSSSESLAEPKRQARRKLSERPPCDEPRVRSYSVDQPKPNTLSKPCLTAA